MLKRWSGMDMCHDQQDFPKQSYKERYREEEWEVDKEEVVKTNIWLD